MKTVQAKFFEVLEARAKKDGFEVVVDYSASNVGTLHLQQESRFKTAVSVPFNFQSGAVCAHFGGRAGSSRQIVQDLFPGRPNPSFAGFGADELDEAVDAIVAAGRRGR